MLGNQRPTISKDNNNRRRIGRRRRRSSSSQPQSSGALGNKYIAFKSRWCMKCSNFFQYLQRQYLSLCRMRSQRRMCSSSIIINQLRAAPKNPFIMHRNLSQCFTMYQFSSVYCKSVMVRWQRTCVRVTVSVVGSMKELKGNVMVSMMGLQLCGVMM